ncbi:oligosaccharide flippase family protein [Lichenicola sp.]|uniref:oligosaccharide flippase family protein n=1 Tax=Lichenicola sp. TaxID=2804529 RepID=UPI003AFF8538
MNENHERLKRGFNWLGGASVIARIVDFLTILTMLLFLTKDQVGIASLVVSIGMVVEALNGLGTGEALIQARSVSREQLDTLFWYVVGAAILAGGLTLAAAPAIAALYGVAGMASYFLAIAVKQPLVGAALIPLALMNRDLQYERIALVNVCATIGAALTRLALGASGAGVWALVIGYSASGLYILIGAMLARPFRARLRFQMEAIRPLARFGTRAVTANVAEQMFKNVDYMLIGWFYGASSLAIYRVAFDVAMEPAMAVGTLVNRTTLPVFARVAASGGQLVEILAWSLRRIVGLVAPLLAALFLVAGPLMSLLHDGQGHSYAAAATPLKLLAIAALLRVVLQLLATMMMGSGRPGTVARLSAMTLLLLSGSILAVGCIFQARLGLIAVSAVWLAIYPLLLGWGLFTIHRHWQIGVASVLEAVVTPLAGVAIIVAVVEVVRRLIDGGPPVQIAIVALATAATYAGLFLYSRNRVAVGQNPARSETDPKRILP